MYRMQYFEELLSFFEKYDVVKFKKGNYIFDPNTMELMPRYIYMLKTGICSLQGQTYNGEDRIYLFLEAPRVIGYVPLISGIQADFERGYHLMAVQAKTDCLAYRVSCQEFLNYFNTDLKFKSMVEDNLLSDYMKVLQNFHNQHEGSAVVKVCKLLLDIAGPEDEVIVIRGLMSYSDIANYIGVHKVTVGRIMSMLYRKGCIVKESDVIVVHPEQLKQIIIEDSDFKYY